MKENFAWLLKNLVLPLTPVICGSLIRYFYSGEVKFDITELAFSIAILYVVLLKSAGRLNDTALADSLTTICFLGIVFCLTIFAYSAFVKLQFEHQIQSNHMNLLKTLDRDPKIDDLRNLILSVDFNSVDDLLSRVKIIMYGVALVSIPMTVVFRLKYKLDN